MVLNRNPVNYFAEVEQLAFDPSNMPPGVEPSPDKMLQVTPQRTFSQVFFPSQIKLEKVNSLKICMYTINYIKTLCFIYSVGIWDPVLLKHV